MKFKTAAACCIFLPFLLTACATFSESGERYKACIRDIREGRDYFAVLHLKAVLKDDPGAPWAPTAAFALGEYYFDNLDHFNSLKILSDYVQSYPKHKGVIFAKLIIYKIITSFEKKEQLNVQEGVLIAEIRKELFAQPLFLIFYDKKAPRSYKSLFNKSYLVYDYVDKIKVFRNDKLFLELTP